MTKSPEFLDVFRGVCLALFIPLFLASCNPQPKATPVPTLSLSAWLSSPTPAATITPVPTNAPVITPKKVLFLLPSEPSPELQTTVTELTGLAQGDGLQVDTKSGADLQDIPADTPYAVLLGQWDGAAALIQKYPQVSFLALPGDSLAPANNLTVVSSAGLSAEEIDFTAGYIAAVISPHWRIGVIGRAESPSRARFLRGAVFFCGLCRSPYPPFVAYPLDIQIGGDQDIAAVVDQLVQAEVMTVYVAPGAETPALFDALAKAGINVISSQPMPQGLGDHWAVSLQGGGSGASLAETWKKFLNQEAQIDKPAQATFQDVNPALFSPGRQALVEEMLRDLTSGKISPLD